MNTLVIKTIRICLILLLIGFGLKIYNSYPQKMIDEEALGENGIIGVANNEVFDSDTGAVEDELQEL